MQQKFPGFPENPTSNYWRYPKALNGWWHILSGSEQKVLDYIVRHTWGYNKTADKISLSQFQKGIRNKKTGEWVDRGIGITKKNTIIAAIQRLEKLGFIKTTVDKGRIREIQLVTNGYQGSNQRLPVGGNQRLHTIRNVTIKDTQKATKFPSYLRDADDVIAEKMAGLQVKRTAS